MPRQLVKASSQVRTTVYIDKRYMDALQQIKRKTNFLITDMMREALSMYVAERARGGMVELDDGVLPYEDWTGLARRVAEALENYRRKATAHIREHGKDDGGIGGDLSEWLYQEVQAALKEYDRAKEKVGTNAKTAEKLRAQGLK